MLFLSHTQQTALLHGLLKTPFSFISSFTISDTTSLQLSQKISTYFLFLSFHSFPLILIIIHILVSYLRQIHKSLSIFFSLIPFIVLFCSCITHSSFFHSKSLGFHANFIRKTLASTVIDTSSSNYLAVLFLFTSLTHSYHTYIQFHTYCTASLPY